MELLQCFLIYSHEVKLTINYYTNFVFHNNAPCIKYIIIYI